MDFMYHNTRYDPIKMNTITFSLYKRRIEGDFKILREIPPAPSFKKREAAL